MRQFIYISTAVSSVAPADLDAILSISRARNGVDNVTGLLYFVGRRFLQVMEGGTLTIARTMARIERDPRHRAIVVLSDRTVAGREFGPWAMESQRPGADFDAVVARVDELCANAAASVRATFLGFAETRRAA